MEELDQVLMEYNRTSSGMVQIAVFTASVYSKLVKWLSNRIKERKAAKDSALRYSLFLDKYGGNIQGNSIPVSEETRNTLNRIEDLEIENDSLKETIGDRTASRRSRSGAKKALSENEAEIKELYAECREIKQLDKLKEENMFDYMVFPSSVRDRTNCTIKLMVPQEHMSTFNMWFQQHLRENLPGGNMKDYDRLKRFTDNRTTIMTFNLEGKDTDFLTSAFDERRINYCKMTDLNIGDGYVQIAFADKDVKSVNEVISAYNISHPDSPVKSGTMSESQFYGTSREAFYDDARAEGAASAPQEERPDLKKAADGPSSPAFVDLYSQSVDRNSSLLCISINDAADRNSLNLKSGSDGYVYGILPGSYRRSVFRIPGDKVFYDAQKERFYAFIDMNKNYEVQTASEKTLVSGREFAKSWDEVELSKKEIDRIVQNVPEAAPGLAQAPEAAAAMKKLAKAL